MSSRGRKAHKWALDLTLGGRLRCERPTTHNPIGYFENINRAVDTRRGEDQNLLVKKSWEIALGPIKQIPMNFFIMWMAGNTISIFPIMMVGMMFFRPIQAFISVQNTFKMIEGGQSHLQKFVYLLGNLMCLGLAVYKCQVMGLLPSHASDWLAFVEPQKRLEWSGGGMSL